MSEELIEFYGNDAEMDGVQFVLRGMYPNPDPTSKVCSHHCVKIQDGEMVGTNGKQLHLFRYDGLYKNGVYRVLKRLKTHVVMIMKKESDYEKEFPIYKDIFENFPMATPYFEKHFPKDDHTIVDGLTMILRALPSFHSVVPAYLMALDDIFECRIVPESDFILFTNPKKSAVIQKYAVEI